MLRFKRSSQKDRNKQQSAKNPQGNFTGKRKASGEVSHRDNKKRVPECTFCKKKGHIKDNCRKLQAKNKKNEAKDSKGKPKGMLPNILEVHTHHLCACECSFPKHVLGPNDLLRAIGHVNGSPVHILFDSGSSHNFIDDQFVQMLGIQIRISDHTYKSI